jgi:hypothetical protein
MKKMVFSLLIAAFFICSNITFSSESKPQISSENHLITFDPLMISSSTTSTRLSYSSTINQYRSNEYITPIISKQYVYPFGTKIESVKVEFINPLKKQLTKPLPIAPKPQTTCEQFPSDSTDSSSLDSQLSASFAYQTFSGLYQGSRKTVLCIYFQPNSFNSDTKILTTYQQANIQIEHLPPNQTNQQIMTSDKDLLIIAPTSFETSITPLINHKESIGINTLFMSTETIYETYPGRDHQEQIKYAIKDVIETHGIRYVLLIGGRNGGVFTEKWHVPVRYSHVDDDSDFETSFISDLYYADIYNETGEFSTWDPDGNGVFSQWNEHHKDILELMPDVIVGRLPCRNKREVTTMVNKIITYETTTDESDLFSRIVGIGGDSAPGYVYNEGEEENKLAFEYMQDFTAVHCWTSDQTLSGVNDVINAIGSGCGFLFFDGHGNPSTWSTHPPDDAETWITGLGNSDMNNLKNGEMFPVTVVGGCHNGQFNVSPLNIIPDIFHYGLNGYFFDDPYIFYHMEWVPECWAWKLTSLEKAGSIATMAYTGLDWFAEGDYDEDGIPDCTQYYSGFANTRFFYNYGVRNYTILGEAFHQTLIDYLLSYPPMGEPHDCKTVQEFTLIGDPSLHIGGI